MQNRIKVNTIVTFTDIDKEQDWYDITINKAALKDKHSFLSALLADYDLEEQRGICKVSTAAGYDDAGVEFPKHIDDCNGKYWHYDIEEMQHHNGEAFWQD